MILGSKIDEKSMKNRSKNRSTIRCDLGSIFGGSWVGFGVDLGAKLEPSWDQIAIKVDPTSDQKNDHLFDGLWMDF